MFRKKTTSGWYHDMMRSFGKKKGASKKFPTILIARIVLILVLLLLVLWVFSSMKVNNNVKKPRGKKYTELACASMVDTLPNDIFDRLYLDTVRLEISAQPERLLRIERLDGVRLDFVDVRFVRIYLDSCKKNEFFFSHDGEVKAPILPDGTWAEAFYFTSSIPGRKAEFTIKSQSWKSAY